MFTCTCAKIKLPGNSGSDCTKNLKQTRPIRHMVQPPGELREWSGRGERSVCILPAQSPAWARLKAGSQGRGRAGVSCFYWLLSLHIKPFSLLADPAPVQPCQARGRGSCASADTHMETSEVSQPDGTSHGQSSSPPRNPATSSAVHRPSVHSLTEHSILKINTANFLLPFPFITELGDNYITNKKRYNSHVLKVTCKKLDKAKHNILMCKKGKYICKMVDDSWYPKYQTLLWDTKYASIPLW